MSSVGIVQPLACTRLDSQKFSVHSVPLPYAFRTLFFPKLSVHAVAPRLRVTRLMVKDRGCENRECRLCAQFDPLKPGSRVTVSVLLSPRRHAPLPSVSISSSASFRPPLAAQVRP